MSGCWLWLKGKGYGQHKGKPAHRYSYELHHGPIPQGLMICHKCDVKACVNPHHLYAGTALDNARDNSTRGKGYQDKLRRHREFLKAVEKRASRAKYDRKTLIECNIYG